MDDEQRHQRHDDPKSELEKADIRVAGPDDTVSVSVEKVTVLLQDLR